ncbi:hypothetical protein [Burkholderia multivorans]|uniref:hypothetical protein n=1 Tax=Burkholderia multivorans TaxID=87883 RepID=UPI0021BE025C|nr:hypothetical protein [Burkholderia multivorans]
MEKLNELLRDYAQSIRRDDGTAFIHADAIREYFRARPSANETGAEGVEPMAVPAGWKLVRVNEHFDALIAALERAESKGYLPETMREEWENFAYDENVTASPPPAQASEPVAWAVYNGWSRICFYMTEEDARDHAQKAQKNHDLSGSLAAFRVVPLYAAPQPAQADARVGLTDEQREVIERAAACLELSELSAERAISDDLRALLAAHPGTGD